MPEALAQTNAFVGAENELATYLADGEVHDGAEAGVAGKSGRGTEDERVTVGDYMPTEGACEGLLWTWEGHRA
jgi:hypothetical protein